jgi:hypothetical protein
MTDYLQGSLPSFCQESPVLSHLEVWKCHVLAFLFLYWPSLGIKVTLLSLFILLQSGTRSAVDRVSMCLCGALRNM